jgi:hypothetical protein
MFALLAPMVLLCAFQAGAASDLVVAGEKFTPRQIVDTAHQNMVALAYMAPASWKDQSAVLWNYPNINVPCTFSVTVTNPANAEAFFLHQPAQFFAFKPDGGLWKDGYNMAGVIKARPQPPASALIALVQRLRGKESGFKLLGTKDLPDLPKALNVQMAKDEKGIGAKITYVLQGTPVEEEFYAVWYSMDLPYDGPRGRTWQTNWGLWTVHSFRAPAGKLDGRREIFAAILKSTRPNPKWIEGVQALKKELAAQWQRNLKAGYDQIAAAGVLSKQLTANSNAFLANVDRQLAASRNASSGSSSSASSGSSQGRSANDNFDDYVRGVVTTDDPYWGQSQHSLTEQYHWTDGYGSYRHSNDASYDPNKQENGSWTVMPQSQ